MIHKAREGVRRAHTQVCNRQTNEQQHSEAGKRQAYGELAQLGEHLPCTQGVKGSNPLFSTTSHKRWLARCTLKTE